MARKSLELHTEALEQRATIGLLIGAQLLDLLCGLDQKLLDLDAVLHEPHVWVVRVVLAARLVRVKGRVLW